VVSIWEGRLVCRKMMGGQRGNGQLGENGWSQVDKINRGERDGCDV